MIVSGSVTFIDAYRYMDWPLTVLLLLTEILSAMKLDDAEFDGKVVYETHLGRFATRAEAETALAQLRGRFPEAVITDTKAPVVVAAPQAPAPAPATAPARAPARAGIRSPKSGAW